MFYFKKFKTYLIPNEPPKVQEIKPQLSGSFELIVADILDSSQSDYFQQIIIEQNEKEEEHEQLQNMYVKDFVIINKYTEGREITRQQWEDIIEKQDLSLQPKKNIYFSILKGIKFEIRKKVWELLASVHQMKKLTNKTYKQLCTEKAPIQCQKQIDKDIPRTQTVTKFIKQLRNILLGYVNFSGRQYVQGMNLIAGCLLELLALENDQELHEFGIVQNQFQERVFWIFVGIMKYKNWQEIFTPDMSGLKRMLSVLQQLMAYNVPAVYQKLIDYEWDLTIFSQYYITIMIYNTPKQLSKVILDLFLLDGQNVLHSLIIRMMKLQQDKIISFDDQGQLMMYFKSGLLKDCLVSLQKQKQTAKKLQDFQINFVKCNKM